MTKVMKSQINHNTSHHTMKFKRVEKINLFSSNVII